MTRPGSGPQSALSGICVPPWAPEEASGTTADERTDETGWKLVESDLSGPENLEQADGFMGENPPYFRREENIDEMIAVDPENQDEPDPDVQAGAENSSTQMTTEELGLLEVAEATRGVPQGWRQDRFGDRAYGDWQIPRARFRNQF